MKYLQKHFYCCDFNGQIKIIVLCLQKPEINIKRNVSFQEKV